MKMTSIEEKLRRYEKIDFLGEGQFATVYKARDRDNDDRNFSRISVFS